MLAQYLRRRVSVITTDGRCLVGVLHAADQLLNLVLTSCAERVFEKETDPITEDNNNNNNSNKEEEDAPMRELPMGVMMIRGSDVVCVTAVNTVEEAKVSVSALRGRNLPPVEEVPRSAMAAAGGN